MIEDNKNIVEYLNKFRDGEIPMGLGLGFDVIDSYLRFKLGQMNMINGLDNVGKTVWCLWWFLCLSIHHGIDHCVWSGENKSGQLVRTLVQFAAGKPYMELSKSEIDKYSKSILKYFTFVSNDRLYTNKDLYKVFDDSGRVNCIIDPYTGMDREYDHRANYNFLNETREYVNKTGKTVWINTHPNTEAARRFYGDKDDDLKGYPMPPTRSQSEGGQPFANRPDDFLTIHRLVGHPRYGYSTHLYVRKVKDTDTGGKVSAIDDPIVFDWNRGLGFTCGGYNPIKKAQEPPTPEFKPIDKNEDFIVDNKEQEKLF